MENLVKTLLNARGIEINDEETEGLVNQWQSYQELQSNLSSATLDDSDIGLVFRPGGVKNE